jgi:hypothetical protein
MVNPLRMPQDRHVNSSCGAASTTATTQKFKGEVIRLMKTQIRILLGSTLLLMATLASAQTQRVAITIPFSFVAGSQNLPAGDYTMELNRETVAVRAGDRSGELKSTMLAQRVDAATKPDETYAIFKHYGEHYFLAEVWREGAGQLLFPTKLQKELARTAADARVEARLARQ